MTAPGHRALREAAAYLRHDRSGPSVDVLWLRGDGARDAVLRLLSSRLLLRDGQAQQSLLLRDDGTILADVTVCADDESYLLVIERGPLGRDALLQHLAARLDGLDDVALEDAAPTHEVISLHGPFAWELVAEVLGQDLVALPYLNFFRMDEGLVLRAGKTGEFGYDLLVRRELADGLVTRIAEAGAAFDAVEIDAGTLSAARFEGWFFDPSIDYPAIEGLGPVTPIELQLQWRLSQREHVGRAALLSRRAALSERPELARKLACVVLSATPEDDVLRLDGAPVGALVRKATSPASGLVFGAALLRADLAHAGLVLDAAGARAKVVAPPLLDNRSLYVDARRHAYRTRDEIAFGAPSRLSAPEAP